MTDDFVLRLSTERDAVSLTRELRQFEPWSIQIDFDNGVSTKDLERRVPFANNPLSKLSYAAKHLPMEQLAGGDLLDIGCNSGYNSIHAANTWGFRAVGVDFNPRHLKVSRMLADMAGVEAEFVLGSAEVFSRPSSFDLVLHFGTLYHLPNPLLALEKAFDNLRQGGYLALESQFFDHPDDENLCYFMHMQNNDSTNFWALSPSVARRYLMMVGFAEPTVVLSVKPAMLEEGMSRQIWVAQKPRS